MMLLKCALVFFVLLVLGSGVVQESDFKICRHRSGKTVQFDPARADRAWKELAKKLAAASVTVSPAELFRDEPFDNGLPACRYRKTRAVDRDVPVPLLGKRMLWTQTSGKADVVFRTKASSLRELIQSGALPGDKTVAKRWGIRCVPSLVRFQSRHQIQIIEGGAE